MMIGIVPWRNYEGRMGRETAMAFATVFVIDRIMDSFNMSAMDGAGSAARGQRGRGEAAGRHGACRGGRCWRNGNARTGAGGHAVNALMHRGDDLRLGARSGADRGCRD